MERPGGVHAREPCVDPGAQFIGYCCGVLLVVHRRIRIRILKMRSRIAFVYVAAETDGLAEHVDWAAPWMTTFLAACVDVGVRRALATGHDALACNGINQRIIVSERLRTTASRRTAITGRCGPREPSSY